MVKEETWMRDRLKNHQLSTARSMLGFKIPEEYKRKIQEIADAQGKSFDDALKDVLADGLAARDETLKTALTPTIRKMVIDTLTVDEIKKVMEKTRELWTAWTESTDSAIKFVAKGTPVEEEEEKPPVPEKTDAWSIHEQFEKRVLEEMGEEEGKPILPEGSKQQQGITKQESSPFHDMLSGIGKYALDKLLNPDTLQAVTKLLKDNPKAQKGIGILIDLLQEYVNKRGD